MKILFSSTNNQYLLNISIFNRKPLSVAHYKLCVAFVLVTVYSNCFCLLVFREASDNLTVQNLKGSFSNASGIITNCNLNIIMLVCVYMFAVNT